MNYEENYEKISKFINELSKKENPDAIEKYILGLQKIINQIRLEILDLKHNEGYFSMDSSCVEELADNIEELFKKIFGNIDMNYTYEKVDDRNVFKVELVKLGSKETLLGLVCLKADSSLDALYKADTYFSKANNLNVIEGASSICNLNKASGDYPSRILYVKSNSLSLLDDVYKLRVVDIE